MLLCAVAAGTCGKTTMMQYYLLRKLLKKPREILPGAGQAPERYGHVFIVENSGLRADGAQFPFPRFHDLSAWKRAAASSNPRVVCFDTVDLPRLCAQAMKLRDTLVVLDELDEHLPESKHELHADVKDMIQRGRHAGCALVGGVRGFNKIHIDARRNMQIGWFGTMPEQRDRDAVSNSLQVPRALVDGLAPYQFLEVHRGEPVKYLVTFPPPAHERRVLRVVQADVSNVAT